MAFKGRPELLLPAGDLEKLKFAFQYGADAVYAGLPAASLRARPNGFGREDLIEGVKYAHDLGKKIYITVNIFPHNSKLPVIEKHLEWLRDEVKPDALIVADPGVIHMIKDIWPDCEIHLSVQANNLNWRQIKFWQDMGVTRVILSRELRLKEIQEIHEKVPDMELEAFVHGAICIAYSGRCLISNYMSHRDPNMGTCSHSCRWKYKVHIEEEKRPGEFYPFEEDEHGSYMMNAKDQCLIPYLKELADAGVCSLKVEGRAKTIYYAATVAKYYDLALKDMLDGKPFNPELLEKVRRTAHRPDSPGFLFGTTEDSVYYDKNRPVNTWLYTGVVREVLGDKKYLIDVRNKVEVGTEIEVVTPEKDFMSKVEAIIHPESKEEEQAAHGGNGERIFIIEGDMPVGSFIRQQSENAEGASEDAKFECPVSADQV
jgi:putative protease